MSYPYPSHQIQEILTKPKCLPPGQGVELERYGKEKKSFRFETRPLLVSSEFIDMRFGGIAPRIDEPELYDAHFLLANQRVRGVGYCAVENQNLRFKKRIPKGWHLNVCDPNLPTNDVKQNIHHPLEDFNPTDFQDFIGKTADLWNIHLGKEREGGLFR